jgi:hypothetical protein
MAWRARPFRGHSVICPDLSLKYSWAPGASLAGLLGQSPRVHDYGPARPSGLRLCHDFPANFCRFP